jgi:hypothetical protein
MGYPDRLLKRALHNLRLAGEIETEESISFNATTGVLESEAAEAGAIPVVIVTITGDDSPYALAADVTTLLVETEGDDIEVTLPASPVVGRIVNIKKMHASNVLTVDGNGKLIDGVATEEVTINYSSLQLQYTGTEWSKI